MIRPLGIATLASLAACGGELICTLIGCVNSIYLTFDEPLANGTVVQVEVPGTTTLSIECGSDQSCANGVFFEDVVAESLTVRVTTSAGVSVHPLTPEYEESRPNGANCEPTCYNATIAITLP